MSRFELKWVSPAANTPGHELTKLTKAPSVSSVSDSSGPFEPKNRVWDDEEIYRTISLGKPFKLWSRVLGAWVYWVRDDRLKAIVEQQDSTVAVYTVHELRELIDQCAGNSELRAVQSVKAAFPGTKLKSLKNSDLTEKE